MTKLNKMEKFNLSEWLKDKSRKVVTRRGNPVRIICTDRKHGEDDLPIVFLEESNGGEFLLTCKSNGRDGSSKDYDTQYDLFFADEEEELTEFEKAIYIDICTIVTACNGNVYGDKELKPIVKGIAKDFLDLARKEFESERDRTCEEAILSQVYSEGYEQGKQDALKDLPKWKKSTLPIPDEEYPTGFNGKYFCYKGYCVDYKKLFEILPKEETDE